MIIQTVLTLITITIMGLEHSRKNPLNDSNKTVDRGQGMESLSEPLLSFCNGKTLDKRVLPPYRPPCLARNKHLAARARKSI
mmetsp:Transcript_156064/g.276805  ORF Transcript_156064/g.276805 Transcript_156064/m.276805 type:complete len:82 (-) Transcript_156064:226-471(-)